MNGRVDEIQKTRIYKGLGLGCGCHMKRVHVALLTIVVVASFFFILELLQEIIEKVGSSRCFLKSTQQIINSIIENDKNDAAGLPYLLMALF